MSSVPLRLSRIPYESWMLLTVLVSSRGQGFFGRSGGPGPALCAVPPGGLYARNARVVSQSAPAMPYCGPLRTAAAVPINPQLPGRKLALPPIAGWRICGGSRLGITRQAAQQRWS
jgi:hypothetical protein